MKKNFRSTTECSAELAEDEIENMKYGSWVIDCARLELKQRGHKGTTYSGPGSLRQDAESQLVYKIYTTCHDDFQTLWHNDLGTPGSVISEHSYYDLTATDSKGREWHRERILPGATNWGASKELVIEGRVDSLSCRGEIPKEIRANGCSLSFVIFDTVKIPTNARTSEHRHVAGWSRSHRYHLPGPSSAPTGISSQEHADIIVTDEHAAVLEKIGNSEGNFMTDSSVAEAIGAKRAKAQMLLEELANAGYVSAEHVPMIGECYSLTRKGTKYLIDRELI